MDNKVCVKCLGATRPFYYTSKEANCNFCHEKITNSYISFIHHFYECEKVENRYFCLCYSTTNDKNKEYKNCKYKKLGNFEEL